MSGFISQSLKESLLDKREFKHPMQNILNLSDAAEVWNVRVKEKRVQEPWERLGSFHPICSFKISREHQTKSYVTPKPVQSKHIVNQPLQSRNHRIYNQETNRIWRSSGHSKAARHTHSEKMWGSMIFRHVIKIKHAIEHMLLPHGLRYL